MILYDKNCAHFVVLWVHSEQRVNHQCGAVCYCKAELQKTISTSRPNGNYVNAACRVLHHLLQEACNAAMRCALSPTSPPQRYLSSSTPHSFQPDTSTVPFRAPHPVFDPPFKYHITPEQQSQPTSLTPNIPRKKIKHLPPFLGKWWVYVRMCPDI